VDHILFCSSQYCNLDTKFTHFISLIFVVCYFYYITVTCIYVDSVAVWSEVLALSASALDCRFKSHFGLFFFFFFFFVCLKGPAAQYGQLDFKICNDDTTTKQNSCFVCNFLLLTEFLQCYCGEIQEILTSLISLYCPKAYHRPEYLIHIIEHHGKTIIIIPKLSIFTETQTQDSFWVCGCSSSNLLIETFCSFAVFLFSLVSELQKTSSLGLKHRTVFLQLWPLFLKSPYHTNSSL
jgi:hypothetical protein